MATIEKIDKCLHLNEPFMEDNSIDSFQYQDHSPQNQRINDRSDIIIEVNSTNSYILPSESKIIIQGQLRKSNANHDVYANADEVALVNNAMMFLFREIRYSIQDKEIERIANPGQITSMLGYANHLDDFSTSSGLSMCWSKDTSTFANSSKYRTSAAAPAANYTPSENPEYNQGFAARKSFLISSNPNGYFEFIIPFSHIFGFSEYKKVIWGLKHTLRLTPHTNDDLAIYRRNTVDAGEVHFTRIVWSIPNILIEPSIKTDVNTLIVNNKITPATFRARTSFCISVPEGNAPFQWSLTVPGGTDKPRWIFVGFQTDKSRTQEQNPALFDHMSTSNHFIELNGVKYPTFDIITNFTTNKFSKAYNAFCSFKNEYHGYDDLIGGTQISFPAFRDLFTIFVFNVSRQDEKMKQGVITMNLTFKFDQAVPQNTMAYALVLSDRKNKIDSDGRILSLVSH